MKNLSFLSLLALASIFSFCKNEAKRSAPTAEKTASEAPKIDSFLKPEPRAAMPADAMCFRAKDRDGQRMWELRMLKMKADGSEMRGDLQVTGTQSTEFAQGRIDGLKKDGNGYFGSWSFRVFPTKTNRIQLVSFIQKGKNLVERSQNPDDDGRVFEPCSCADLK